MLDGAIRRRDSEPPGAKFVLPVSGLTVAIHRATGVEDVLLAEGRADDAALALALVESRAWSCEIVDWATLPIADIDHLVVRMRQSILGDRVISDTYCTDPACRSRMDVSFGLDEFLAHHRPRRAPARGRSWAAEVSAEHGWFIARSRGGDEVAFRLPTIGDLIQTAGAPTPDKFLAQACIAPDGASPRSRALAERAMAALAPPLSGPISGRCPHCAIAVSFHFDARVYCLRELCDRARFIYEDVDTLAQRYHWSETAILSLPNDRRSHYADLARQARLAAG
ncbi:hypothetical protein [Bradyrhizobium tropiciagri]|uniref:hypothetical protein n=1 Tax=Bradyrhizobium tropiciagri TaxID=312253 RepID=UPI00067B3000|nr:hypothetical protein [Bradyrhizobium tropiciagri]